MLDPAKKYRLRGPTHSRLVNPIIIVDLQKAGAHTSFPIIAFVVDEEGQGTWETWTADGKYTLSVGYSHDKGPHAWDLVEDKPEWVDWPIDTPVLHRESPLADYLYGHYAGEAGGKPMVWYNGRTSWSSRIGERAVWADIKRAPLNQE